MSMIIKFNWNLEENLFIANVVVIQKIPMFFEI